MPLDADPGGAERGQIIHAVLDEFVRAWPTALPADPQAELLRIGAAPFRSASRIGRRSRRSGGRASCAIAAWFGAVEGRGASEVARDARRGARRASS